MMMRKMEKKYSFLSFKPNNAIWKTIFLPRAARKPLSLTLCVSVLFSQLFFMSDLFFFFFAVRISSFSKVSAASFVWSPALGRCKSNFSRFIPFIFCIWKHTHESILFDFSSVGFFLLYLSVVSFISSRVFFEFISTDPLKPFAYRLFAMFHTYI